MFNYKAKLMETKIKLYKNFFSPIECETILKKCLDKFEIDKRTYAGWYARTNRDINFENYIKEKIEKISPINPFHIVWINLTEYENNRYLDFHTDERSECTFTIPLTDGYDGGDFLIEDKKFKLEKGECISFDGFRLRHGVEPVTKGYRAALNIWIKPGRKPIF